jgi:hypothetical protein
MYLSTCLIQKLGYIALESAAGLQILMDTHVFEQDLDKTYLEMSI